MDDLLPKMPRLSTTAPGQAPAGDAATATGPRIPLQAGLVVTSVVATADGDDEADARFIAATRDGLTLTFRSLISDDPVGVTRTLRRVDLAQASSFRYPAATDSREQIDGTTALGLSTRGLRELRDSGGTTLTLHVGTATPADRGEGADLAGELDAMLGEDNPFAGIEEAVDRQVEHGTLTDAERAQGAREVGDLRRLGLATGRLRNTGPLKVAVIVNDRRVLLDAITATGSLSNGRDQFTVSAAFLDDDANPLALRLSVGGYATQVTRIGYAQSSLAYASQIEQALQRTCRVDVYGLVFAPGGDTLQPGSEESVATLRSVFTRHPEWTVAVLSHGDAFEPLSLSADRARAIRRALASEDAARLVAVPLPRRAPLASDDSVAGRALNRRTTFSRKGCAR